MLRILSLSRNNLQGSLPDGLSNLPSIEFMFVQDNQFAGELPASYGALSTLINFSAFDNNLSGAIPPEWCALTNLTALNLENNNLTGEIPKEIGQMTSLTEIWLKDNHLSGCYAPELNILCTQLNTSINNRISNGNNFDAPWEDFCANGLGACIPTNNTCTCDFASDEAALVDLYNATGGANWSMPWNLSRSYDHWSGVILDTNSCVQQLLLVNRNLIGTLPSTLGNLSVVENLNLSPL